MYHAVDSVDVQLHVVHYVEVTEGGREGGAAYLPVVGALLKPRESDFVFVVAPP